MDLADQLLPSTISVAQASIVADEMWNLMDKGYGDG